MHVQAQLK